MSCTSIFSKFVGSVPQNLVSFPHLGGKPKEEKEAVAEVTRSDRLPPLSEEETVFKVEGSGLLSEKRMFSNLIQLCGLRRGQEKEAL